MARKPSAPIASYEDETEETETAQPAPRKRYAVPMHLRRTFQLTVAIPLAYDGMLTAAAIDAMKTGRLAGVSRRMDKSSAFLVLKLQEALAELLDTDLATVQEEMSEAVIEEAQLKANASR